MLCTLAFSSCQKNYEKLIEGSWLVNVDKSYYVNDGNRNYFGDAKNGAPFIRIQFEKGVFYMDDGQKRVDDGKYHIDKDVIYIKGDGAQISTMNNTTLVLESAEVHIELDRINYDWFRMFFLNINCLLPSWLWLIILYIVSPIVYITMCFIFDKDLNYKWWMYLLYVFLTFLIVDVDVFYAIISFLGSIF